MYISNAFNFGQIDSIHGDLRGYEKENQFNPVKVETTVFIKDFAFQKLNY